MNRRTLRLGLGFVLTVVLLGCQPERLPVRLTALPSHRATGPAPGATRLEPGLCPQATPELLSVEPVTSPTDDLLQIVTVSLGNADVITVTAESGVFTATGSPARLEVTLLPGAVHHLEVLGRVRLIRQADGCVYGGYTLKTRRDREGKPLVIEQGMPAHRPSPGAAIVPANVSQLQPLLSITPEARITADFAFVGDDRLVSVGYADWISLWDVMTGLETGRLGEGASAAGLCLASSSDGARLATGGTADDRAVRLWDLATGTGVVLGRHDSLVESVAFSPNGQWLASGGNDNTVRVWDLVRGKPAMAVEGNVPGRLQSFYRLYWQDDHTLLAAGSDAIFSWDVTNGRLVARLARPDKVPFLVDVALSPAGDRLAAAAQDSAVYEWERDARAWKAWPVPIGPSVAGVEFSPDGQLLAAATLEGELLVWQVDTAELLARYTVASGSIAAVRFSPDGRIIAVGGWDSPIWLWGIPSKD